MTVDSDLLSAGALALAAISVFFGLWEPELARARTLKPSPQQEERDRGIKTVTDTITTKAVPLLVASFLILLVTTPPAIGVVVEAVRHIQQHSFAESLGNYDAVESLFLVVWGLLIGLTVRGFVTVGTLLSRRTMLRTYDRKKATA